jgi:hypothetical protein
MAGVGGAAVPGRLSLAGSEARPIELFLFKLPNFLTENRKLKNENSKKRQTGSGS